MSRYNVINGTWEILPPMNYKRFMHASAIISK